MSQIKKHIIRFLRVGSFLAFLGLSFSMGADTVTEGFDSFSRSQNSDWTYILNLPTGWDYTGSSSTFSPNSENYKSKIPSVCVETLNNSGYLITPELEGDFNFWIRNLSKNYAITVKVFACTYVEGVLSLGQELGTKTVPKPSSTPSWTKVSFDSSTPTRVAILIDRGYLDDFTYTTPEKVAGPQLTLEGYPTGSSYDFGGQPVAAGTTKEFTLLNLGDGELIINSISVTGDYEITEGSNIPSIKPQGSAKVILSTPAKDTEGELKIESNDEASPYIINLTSLYKEPRPEMIVSTEPIRFGKVTANATQQVTVGNTGDASLNVTIASNSADFTVNPASLTVEPEQNSTFTVTYMYNEDAYGVHNGKITLTPNYGDTAEITVSAKVQDPTIWSEDFESNSLPAGWEITGSNWTISDGVAHGNFKYGTRDEFTTPALIVQEGEELTFDYKSTGYAVNIEMLISKDGEDFKAYKKESIPNNMSAFETYTISGLEAGSYRLRFINDNYDLDNFEGFHLNNNAPELTVTPDKDADFGKVFAQPEARTYTVYNTGTGLMTVSISSSSDEFTVSPTVLTDISNEEPQTFTVSFNYDVENPGQKSSVISIIPTYNEEMAVTFNATAIAKDPSVWTEDFTGNALPEGWESTGPNWTISDGVAHGKYQPYNQDYLITPSLTVAEGDKMSFNYKSTGYNVDIKVSYKKDYDKEYRDLVTISPDNYMQEFATYTIEGLDPGNYHFRFLSENYDLDEFDGFRLNLNAPELNVTPLDVADFGKVKAVPEAKVYTVTNIGTGLLSVNISSDSEDFTVDPSELTDIEKGDSKTFKVMFNFDPTNLGEKKGVISVTPTYDDASSITFEAMALAKDPNIWEEDFEAGIIPDSWTNDGWTVEKPHTGNGTYMAYSGMNGDATLITPRLYAQKDQELKFLVGNGTDDLDNLTVEYSDCGKEWTPMPGSPLDKGGEKVFIAPEDGYYYLRFRGKYASLDNFVGFKPAPKTRDLSIEEILLPEEADMYLPYVATVKVKETMGNDETAIARLFVDGKVVAESESTEIQANGEATLSLQYIPVELHMGVPVKVMVYYAEEMLHSDSVTLTVNPAPAIDENEAMLLQEGVIPAAELYLTSSYGWNTIALPFSADSELLSQIFGDAYRLFSFTDFEDGKIRFDETTTLEAGQPYIVYSSEPVAFTEAIILRDINIEAVAGKSVDHNGIQFNATFSPMTSEDMNQAWLLGNEQKIAETSEAFESPCLNKAEAADSLLSLRGYFTFPASVEQTPQIWFYDTDGKPLTSDIEILMSEEMLGDEMYDLNGIRISNPVKGTIYIVKGRKVIAR